MSIKQKNIEKCLICGKPVPDYEPVMCCSGFQCCCMGEPVNPCVCSDRCDKALYDFIGLNLDDRRKKAGIELYETRKTDN